MILKELSQGYILDKPAGVATHTPDGGLTPGFLEMASRLLKQPLWAVHRLDRDTSGCLIVTTVAGAVDDWTQKLAAGKKKYIFISPFESKNAVWSYQGRIEKIGSHQFGLIKGEPNSHTSFAKLGPCGLGFLYEAEISTGKTHQIRIHAQASGIPILGDREHGGEDFPRLMLHAQELQLEDVKAVSPTPDIFKLEANEKRKAHFLDYCKFLVSFERRRFFMDFYQEETDAFRLVHREWSSAHHPKLCIEKLGDVLQILNYTEKFISPEFIDSLCEVTQCPHWFLREMFDRGKKAADDLQNIKQTSPELPLQWYVTENKIKFDLRYSQGLSSGLFLDQKMNREKVLHSSQGKRVANFFSYTCGFSVAAALGGADEVVSIDTSASSLDWGKNNFSINGLDPNRYEFFTADSVFFLKSCVRRKRKFDLIILDPPTFSRSKLATFKLKENLPELLDLAFQCLDTGGSILMTTNDETMTTDDLAHIIENSIQKTVRTMIRMEKCIPPYDFEFPLERDTILKGFWVTLVENP